MSAPSAVDHDSLDSGTRDSTTPMQAADGPVPSPVEDGSLPHLDDASDATSDAASTNQTPVLPGYNLLFADEFNGPNGAGVDADKWTSEVGGNGFGNQEREYYTDEPANAHLDDGELVITVTQDGASAHSCWYGPCEVTSARLVTRGKLEVQYGRVEARLKIPFGQGIWPAFWMLGSDLGSAGWPGCGEIDIMENIGREPSTVHGTIHGPGYSGGNGIGSPFELADGAHFSDDFHTFRVEWEADEIRFYVDDHLYATRTPSELPSGSRWVYDHPFFLLLNVAVGGGWPGSPDQTTVFPQVMRVDYVRVYTKQP